MPRKDILRKGAQSVTERFSLRRIFLSKKSGRLRRIPWVVLLPLCLLLLSFFLKGALWAFLVFFAAAIHEGGHVAAAKLLGVKAVCCRGRLFHMTIKYDFSKASYLTEAAVSLAGAAANVIACAVTCLIFHKADERVTFFIFSNVSLSLFNLMPVSGLDGSGALRSLLALILPLGIACRVTEVASALFAFAFFIFSVIIQLRVGANITLLILSSVLFLTALRELFPVFGEK